MIRTVEFTVFAGIAAALHVAMFASFPERSLLGGGGDAGKAQVTVLAASPAQAILAARWQQAPQASDTALAPAPPPAEGAAPVAPGAEAQAPGTAIPSALPATGSATALPIQPEALPRPPSMPSLTGMAMTQPAPPAADAPALPRTLGRAVPPRPLPSQPPARQNLILPPQNSLPQVDTAAPPRGPRPKARPPRPAPQAKPAAPRKPTPAARPAPAAKPAPQQSRAATPSRATGTQDRTRRDSARDSSGNAPATSDENATRRRLDRWGAGIFRSLQRATGRAGLGTTARKPAVTVSLDRSGRLLGATMRRSTGDPQVDRAILSIIRRIHRLPAAPRGLTRASYSFSFDLTVR